MEGTPDERVSFLLPDTSLVVESSSVSTEQAVRVRKAFQLENPQPLLAENGEDLAAFLLEQQMQEEGRSHFYQVDESNVHPETVTQVGLLGYAGITRISIGANFMATLYVTFGEMVNGAPNQSDAQMSITYPVPQN